MENKNLQTPFATLEDFEGFISVRKLRQNTGVIPTAGGVYIVVRESEANPTFLEKGSGGFHKGKDPNVPISILEENYVAESKILYIGKATSLRKRLSQLLRFGAGAVAGHYGGRFLWQLADSDELLIAWKQTPLANPRDVEVAMLMDFAATYGRLPFANLTI